MHQSRYVEQVEHLPPSAIFDQFRSLRHKLAWLGHTRPDLLAPVNILSQVTASSFVPKHIKLINSIVARARRAKGRGLLQQRLDKSSLRMVAYADSSFTNDSDSSTQLGFVILQGARTIARMYSTTAATRRKGLLDQSWVAKCTLSPTRSIRLIRSVTI